MPATLSICPTGSCTWQRDANGDWTVIATTCTGPGCNCVSSTISATNRDGKAKITEARFFAMLGGYLGHSADHGFRAVVVRQGGKTTSVSSAKDLPSTYSNGDQIDKPCFT